MRREAGTTLLEAIVALSLLAIGAMALFAWMGTHARTFDRVAANAERLSMERSALAVIEHVNPMTEPRGRREIVGLTVEWTARQVTPTKPGRGPGGPVTVFDVALYDVAVEVDQGDGETSRFTVRKLGWVTARSFEVQP
jgi:general secretion pathway protein I